MVDVEKLGYLIKESGLPKEMVAGLTGMSLNTLNNKLAQRTGIYIEEAEKFRKILKMNQQTFLDVFFKDDVGITPTTREVSNG